jgi:hypothetical protein
MDARKGRALLERLYLLEAARCEQLKDGGWSFIVRGSTGKNYDVVLSANKVSCSCFDCKQRRRICKHIYFIIGRVAQNKELLVQLGDNLNVNVFALDPLLSEKINNRINGRAIEVASPTVAAPSSQSAVERDVTCSICYEDTEVHAVACSSCKNVFHNECINIWTSRKPTCPLCRNRWLRNEVQKASEVDELAFFLSNLRPSDG